MSGPLLQNPLMASLEAAGRHQVGAHFESLYDPVQVYIYVAVAPSDFPCIFITIQTLLLEQC